jgi:anti-sigma B factor antagonist
VPIKEDVGTFVTRKEAGLGLSINVGARQGGGTVITLLGELDMGSAPELKRAIERAVDAGDELEIDMRACSFVDSVGIATLVTAARHMSEHRRTLRIRGAQERVVRILELAGLTSHRWVVFEPESSAN